MATVYGWTFIAFGLLQVGVPTYTTIKCAEAAVAGYCLQKVLLLLSSCKKVSLLRHNLQKSIPNEQKHVFKL